MITLEQVDQLRKRTNCSYEEAKELLEKHNGDVLEAIVDFEKNRKGKSYSNYRNYGSDNYNGEYRNRGDFWRKVREVIQLGFDNRLMVEDSKGIILNVPINILLLLVIFIPYITIPIFFFLLILGYKISVKKLKGNDVNISEIVKDAADKFAGKGQYQQTQQPVSRESDQKSEDDNDDSYNKITIE